MKGEAVLRIWTLLVPALRQLPAAERAAVLAQARRSSMTQGETLAFVAWLVVVFLVMQALQRKAAHDNPIAFALVVNLVIALPLLLLVLVPLQLRKIRRHVAGVLEERRQHLGA